jgi:N-acetyl sugar amidotransferase
MGNYKICTRCILDTKISDIWFDEDGVCKYCKIHDELEKAHPTGEEGKQRIQRIVEKIKTDGKEKEYDCIVGVSGGRDSTYTLYMAVKLGLRPLAVHFDNGWDSEIAVTNIKNATTELDVDLHTVVADWEEFKDLQIAFLKASVPDAEVPTDYVIYSVLCQAAAEQGVKYVIEGHSFRTEGTSPVSWSYMDGRYIRTIHKKFGKKKITSFPIMSLSKFLYYVFVKRIRVVRVLEFMDYRQKEAERILKDQLGWEYYGGHHHESIYTHFFQSYLLPRKFSIDKRKTEYSALIRSGQKTREEALAEVRNNEYPYDEEIVKYTICKLGLTREEFDEIFMRQVHSFKEFSSYYPIIRSFKWPIKVAASLGIVPRILYLKYAK